MYKFAVLPYLNAAPLVHFLPEICPDAELVYRKPRETLHELTSGRVDAAIVPVVDYFDTPDLEIVEGLGICADGGVESVLLQCRRPLKEVRTIGLDLASRTSNRLVKVLLEKHFCLSQAISLSADAVNADAFVIIGDRALCAESALESYDLAAEWKKMTDLPFVFAVWTHPADHPESRRISEILHAAKDSGCGAIEDLSKLHAGRLGLPQARCYHYLASCLHYDIGPEEKAGMRLFRELSMHLMNRTQEEHQSIQRIVRNEHKYKAVEPVSGPLR